MTRRSSVFCFEAILKRGLDRAPLTDEKTPDIVVHENIRGGNYFDKEEEHKNDNSTAFR